MSPKGIGWDDFVAARSRLFAMLERDTEIRRLEIAWRRPFEVAPADAEGRPVTPGDVGSDGAAVPTDPDDPGNGRLDRKTEHMEI